MLFVKGLINFLVTNWDLIAATILALVGLAELVVRFTPTKKDDGAVQRFGALVTKILNFIKVPNSVKKDVDNSDVK